MKNKQKHVSPQLDNSKCTGCAACYSACPKGCIRMQEDNEGFLYPIVNENECIDCGLCQKVCPTHITKAPIPQKQILAIKNKQTEVRMRSSSGYLANRHEGRNKKCIPFNWSLCRMRNSEQDKKKTI